MCDGFHGYMLVHCVMSSKKFRSLVQFSSVELTTALCPCQGISQNSAKPRGMASMSSLLNMYTFLGNCYCFVGIMAAETRKHWFSCN